MRKSDLTLQADGTAVTATTAKLRLLPDTRPFLFGTNNAGQDLWAMVWAGTRTSLTIGIVVAFCQAALGILIGVLWGYVRSLDRLLTEVYNVIDNIPTTIVLDRQHRPATVFLQAVTFDEIMDAVRPVLEEQA